MHQPFALHASQPQRGRVVVNVQGSCQLTSSHTAWRRCKKRNDRRIRHAAIASSSVAMREPGWWRDVPGFIVGFIGSHHDTPAIGRPCDRRYCECAEQDVDGL